MPNSLHRAMVLVETSSTCMSLVTGKFLGSKDRIAIAGNCPHASVEVIYVEQDTSSLSNDSASGNAFIKTSGLYLDGGKCVDFELCGIPRLARVFGAIAKTNPTTFGGSISLVDIETSYDTSSLQSKADEEFSKLASNCPYTSLAFNSNQEVLLAGCEDGAVVSWDLNTLEEIHRFDGDACGVNKVKFIQTGQLITLGSATGRPARQLKIWDLRMSGEQSECFALKQSSIGKGSSSSSSSSKVAAEESDRRFTCVCCHPIDEKIILGTAQGSIIVWDLRSGASEEFHTHSSPVTDCMVHPSQRDTIVSSSSGGQVKALNTSSSLSIDCFDTIGAVTSLDYDLDSSMMLAVTSIGGLVRMKL